MATLGFPATGTGVAAAGPSRAAAPPVRLSVSGLEKGYGGRPAVRGVSFDLTPGITGLLGPNGAGKSTLLRCVAGIADWERGDVTVDGVDASRSPRAARRRLGFMPERVAFPAEIAVEDYLMFVARLKAVPRRRRREAAEAARPVASPRRRTRRRDPDGAAAPPDMPPVDPS